MTSTWADDALTCDAFLGGRLMLWQPRAGYRAGVDAVLLAAAIPAEAGQSVLDLGCGVGAAALSLSRRVPGLAVTGVEVQPPYAALARRNTQDNGLALDVVEADLRALPGGVRAQAFDHVIANPPYYDRLASSPAQDPGRDIALGGDTPLADWAETATRRLRPGGWLTLIQHVMRLPDVLGALDDRLGAVEVLPVAGRAGAAPSRFLLRARKGGRAAFRLWPALVLHEGPAHLRDAESYTPQAQAILRDAASLVWPR
ncbi:MAG: methyltransferase [Rhodobacterales bacterium]|nr:methyltransferase [Rhodobacterales bacterium]NCT11365.1 methyltransferase [Rhodobacterales bacterium]